MEIHGEGPGRELAGRALPGHDVENHSRKRKPDSINNGFRFRL
jgi:hypothetical protein